MASKRKTNGRTTVSFIEGAIKKRSCSMEDFFFEAACAEDARRRSEGEDPLLGNWNKNTEEFIEYIKHEVRRFCLFAERGLTESPKYEIPVWVVEYARQVCPSRSRQTRQTRQRKSQRRVVRVWRSSAVY